MGDTFKEKQIREAEGQHSGEIYLGDKSRLINKCHIYLFILDIYSFISNNAFIQQYFLNSTLGYTLF